MEDSDPLVASSVRVFFSRFTGFPTYVRNPETRRAGSRDYGGGVPRHMLSLLAGAAGGGGKALAIIIHIKRIQALLGNNLVHISDERDSN